MSRSKRAKSKCRTTVKFCSKKITTKSNKRPLGQFFVQRINDHSFLCSKLPKNELFVRPLGPILVKKINDHYQISLTSGTNLGPKK